MTDQLTYRTWYTDEVATGDATPTTISTIAIPSGTIVRIIAEIVARRTGGSAGSAEDGAGYRATATFQNIGGTAILIAETIDAEESDSAWDVGFSASGANALLQVTGAADTSIAWKAEYRHLDVTTV